MTDDGRAMTRPATDQNRSPRRPTAWHRRSGANAASLRMFAPPSRSPGPASPHDEPCPPGPVHFAWHLVLSVMA